jgi:hypothetical protein
MRSDWLETEALAGSHATRPRIAPPLLVLFFSALLSGCVGAAGVSGSSSNSSGLTATPSAITFGNVNTGTTTTQSVAISNAGIAPLSVSKVSLSGAGFNASGVPVGLVLTPGQTATLSVSFAPASTGSVAGSVSVADATSPDPVAIVLSGTGVTPSGHSVNLTWNASTSSITGYRTYRATTAGGPYALQSSLSGSQLQWKDSSVQPGTTYYYVVTALAANSAESTYSNQASAAVPKP